MKKTLSVTSAAALALCIAGPSSAQSSVTVYGVVDAYAQALDGASSLGRLQSGGLSGSRIGFRGTEDLGGGLQAFFVLEGGINLDDGTMGQGGAMFGRQAFVGLRSGGWGSVSFGRQYSSLYTVTTDFSLFSNNPAGPSTALIGGFAGGYEPVRGSGLTATGNGGPARVNNSFRYETPNLSGFRASLLYGAGEVAGGTEDTRLLDLGLRYTSGGLDLMLSVVDDRASSATPVDATVTSVGGSYQFQPFRVSAGYLQVDDGRAVAQDGRGFWLGGDFRTGQHVWRAQYVESKPKFGFDNKSTAFGLGWGYDLSRRTQLYSSLTRFENDNLAGGSGLGRFNAAVPSGLTRLGDNSITELVLGVRHGF